MSATDKDLLFPLLFIIHSWVTPDPWWFDAVVILVLIVVAALAQAFREAR